MSKVTNEKELLEQIAGLPREISPQHDPWPQISARIEQGAGRGRRWLAAVAAVAVVAITAGLMFGPAGLRQAGPPQTPAPALVDRPAEAVDSAASMQVSLVSSEAEYLAAFREFVAIGDSRSGLEAATIEMIESGWAEMQTTETALATALQENPNDEFLNKRMLELRARQLGFLQQLASLDMNNRRLTI